MEQNRRNVIPSSVIWIVTIAVVGYAVVLVLMYLFQAAFVYFPTRNIAVTPEIRDLAYEDVWLYTDDDIRIHGWYVPSDRDRGYVLFFHGNAGNISDRIESIVHFNNLGLNVLIIDYRGYGNSEGRPSEQGTYRDAEAGWRYLTEVREASPSHIILFGRSLGGGVASWLASQVEAGGLVLESTFTSAVDLASDIYPMFPVRLLMYIRYPVTEYLKDITMPVMVAHSVDDEIIPYYHGRKLYEQLSEPKMWLEMQGGHNDGFLQTGPEYLRVWDKFLHKALD